MAIGYSLTFTQSLPIGSFKVSIPPQASTSSHSSRLCPRFVFSPRLKNNLNHTYISSTSRHERINSKCLIINSNVQFDQVSVEDDVQKADCSLPIVSLNSSFLQADTSTLQTKPPTSLNDITYVDSLLTTLPVLSEEEENALATTPAHPAGLYALYASCIVGNLVEQLWNFACPSAIALLHSSLQPVAVMGLFTKLALIVGGPLIGKYMDSFPRVPAYTCLNCVQVAAQLLSASMVIYAHTVRHFAASSSILLQPWFVTLVFATAIERLTGTALGVAIERDWVVLLAGINRPTALSEANAVLSRIKLLCEIVGASLFGIFLSKYDPVTCLKFAVGLMSWSLPVVVGLTWLTNQLSTGVLDRAKCSQTCCANPTEVTSTGAEIIMNVSECIVEVIKNGWKEYLQLPVLPASLAYVILCLNALLAPGSLMTAFLTQQGLSLSNIGGFSGLCAFMGVTATFLSANLVRQFRILKAGAVGLTFQAALLTVAIAVYWSGPLSRQRPFFFFLSMIVLSRLGHMLYDVVGQQILQTGIPSSKTNLIASTEVSVSSLAESIIFGVAIVANDTSHFRFLAMLSLLSVVGAVGVFCHWLFNPTDEQRKLFSSSSQFEVTTNYSAPH